MLRIATLRLELAGASAFIVAVRSAAYWPGVRTDVPLPWEAGPNTSFRPSSKVTKVGLSDSTSLRMVPERPRITKSKKRAVKVGLRP